MANLHEAGKTEVILEGLSLGTREKEVMNFFSTFLFQH